MVVVQSKLAEAEEDAASQFERVSELENEVMLMEARATSAEARQQQLQVQLQEAASKPVSYACLARPYDYFESAGLYPNFCSHLLP